LRHVPGTRSAYAERAAGGYFVDFELRRDALARYGLSVAEVQQVILSAVGGENVTTTIEGRARYPVNVRYPRELRDDLDKLGRVLVMTPGGAQIPLSQVADLRTVTGPAMIRNENALLAGYVFVDTAESDIGGYVDRAKAAVAAKVTLPAGYSLEWSGQYENMLRVRERLKLVVPVTLVLILLLLYGNTGSAVKTAMVLLAVPFSAIGAVWLMWALDYNVSIAAWVGVIALLPILWSTGTGSDLMKRVAAPMVGGLATSFALELLVYPVLYLIWRRRQLGV
jgi:Cu(I)/Ag(I) efflux system membrane protein CusA/SilA